MAEIIKTWPACVRPEATAQLFSEKVNPFCTLCVTIGRARPKQEVSRLWFTYQGRILGSFAIDRVVVNDGTLPKLRSIEDQESEWQIKKDAWVAICSPPCMRLRERLFMSGFRGFRYFDLERWRGDPESRVRL